MADRQSLEETTNCEHGTQCAGVNVRNVKFTRSVDYKEDNDVNKDCEVDVAAAAAEEEEKADRVPELPTEYVRNVKFMLSDVYTEDIDLNEDGELAAATADEEAGQVPELPTEYEVQEVTPRQTPDGGWGWMVVVAAFVTNLIVDGISYIFGVLMPELIDYFGTSKQKTALVGSLIAGVYMIVGNYYLWFLFLFSVCRNSYFVLGLSDQRARMSKITKRRRHRMLYSCTIGLWKQWASTPPPPHPHPPPF